MKYVIRYSYISSDGSLQQDLLGRGPNIDVENDVGEFPALYHTIEDAKKICAGLNERNAMRAAAGLTIMLYDVLEHGDK